MVYRNLLKKVRLNDSINYMKSSIESLGFRFFFFSWVENGLEMSDKRIKHGNEGSLSRRSKAHSFSYVTFTDGLAAWGEQKQKQLFNNPLQGHSSGCAWFPPDSQVPAMTLFLLLLSFSIHTPIYPFVLLTIEVPCTHADNVESEAMPYGNKCITTLLVLI